jgi:YfiH family protein
MEWREKNGVRWLAASLPSATAVFSTRTGGVSEPPFDGLNLGALTDDAAEAIAENRRLLVAALGFAPEAVASGHQVHGSELATHGDSPSQPIAVDGHVIAQPGVAGLVFVADCVPVALSGPDGAAILHCGWRGLAAGIVAKGVAAIGATDAAVGPSIGPCCYEVGPEVLAPFEQLGDSVADGRMLDLPEVARRLLLEAGVKRVELSGLCTSCEPELFFSHRRDHGRTGRQAGLVWREAEED